MKSNAAIKLEKVAVAFVNSFVFLDDLQKLSVFFLFPLIFNFAEKNKKLATFFVFAIMAFLWEKAISYHPHLILRRNIIMSDLLLSYIVRPAEKLTPKQIDGIGIHSHPTALQSSRYQRWMELCEAEKYTELENHMREFLEGPDAIHSLKQIPLDLRKPIEFADYNGYRFTKEEFLSQIDLGKLSTEFGIVDKGGYYVNDSGFVKTYSNIADQLIAETRITINSKRNTLDKQAILKTLILIERIFIAALKAMIQKINEDSVWLESVKTKAIVNKKELEEQIRLDAQWMFHQDSSRVFEKSIKFDINIGRLYDKPIILSSCIINIDPCKGVARVPNKKNSNEVKNAEKNSTVAAGEGRGNGKEDDCGCEKVPEKDDCECKCDETCVTQNPCCAEIVPYVAELYVVKEKIKRYEVGEMSYIENVLETEIRERTHRSLEREEIYTEHEDTTTSYEEKDLQVDERFSLHKEIDKTVEQALKIDAGVTAHQKWGTGDVTATTNVGYNQSKKDAEKSIQDNAKQVISKSITSLQKKVRDFTSRKIMKESEEINKHIFGGTVGAINDISRQYYFVNQVNKCQTYSYGKRSMLAFYLPEPSELYKRLIEKKFSLKKPEKPCIKIGEITSDKYLHYIKCLGLKDVEFPPKEKIDISGRMNGDPEVKDRIGMVGYKVDRTGSFDDNGSIQIPEGYESISMDASINTLTWNDNYNPPGTGSDTIGGVSLFAIIGGRSVNYYPDASSNISTVSCPGLEGTQAIILKTWDVTKYDITLTVHCKLKPETLLKWQLPIYQKIMEAYEKELAAYNDALVEFEKTKQIKYKQNPFILLQDIQEQLKQAAISYMSCQFFDGMNAMKHKVKPCGYPQMDIQEAKKEGEYVRFLEQAFEWKFMNFIFYPYFWSRKCTWENKMNEEADNMLFQRFLKAGYARVAVSIRQGFEGHIAYFLATRRIWGSTGIPPITGPDFVSIYQEIREDKENFNVERDGTIDGTNGLNVIVLNGTDQYWDSLANTPCPNQYQIDIDKNREIFIDGIQYRIVDIIENPSSPSTIHTSWLITLDRGYEGVNAQNLPWSTGALFIGAPWEFKVPTRLVWLREKGVNEEGRCLPTYPIVC